MIPHTGDSYNDPHQDTGTTEAVSGLPMDRLDLRRGWRNYGRPKTGIERRCPLWPETIAALQEVIARRHAREHETLRNLVLITKYDNCWCSSDEDRCNPNQAPFLLWVRGDEHDQAFLLGVLASVPLDWYARRFVETHVNFHVFNPFPIPRPNRDNPLWRRTVALAGRLACPDKRFAKWAKAVGVKHGKLDPDEKDDMIAELDAVVAHLYGLSEPHLTHIFETFHEGWDYQPRLKAVLKHYKAWAAKA